MSKPQPDGSDVPAEQIPDFAHLDARKVGINQYVVGSRNGDLRGHLTHIRDLECSCEDMQNNNEGSQICKHLAKAIYAAPKDVEIEQAFLELARDEFRRLQDAVDELTEKATHTQLTDAQDTPETTDTQPTKELSETDKVSAWLDSLGIPPSEYTVFVHSEYGSINIEPEGKVDWWNELSQQFHDLEDAWWDGEDRVWIVRDVDELPMEGA